VLTVTVRPETQCEYADIADLHARAFNNRTGEPSVVALLRQHRGYDPDLSLVAEHDGRIAGHALFMPYTIRLLGEDVPAVNLAPIAVHPGVQRQGVGGALIEQGHKIAREGGHVLSFLLGHASYYPRFGYRTMAFGASEVRVQRVEPAPLDLQTRTPLPEDIPALRALRSTDETDVDFSLDPGPDLLDWISPNPAIAATVYLAGDEIVGYTRVHRDHPTHPRIFLSSGADAARAMARTLAHDLTNDVVLPIHPRSRSAAAFPGATVTPWNAAMVCPLQGNRFDRYQDAVQSGERPVGTVTWPVQFDLN
jgi:predicted N-acetyltransferase YhbS